MQAPPEEIKIYEVALDDGDGRVYTGRITGKEIASDDRVELSVYLTEDERVIAYDGRKLAYYQLENPVEELRDWLEPGPYTEAMDAIGEEAVIDLSDLRVWY